MSSVHYDRARKSGTLFEEQVVGVIKRYTTACWQNIRVETLLTKQGNTEMDILFCYQNLVFIVEAKNVSSIFGQYDSKLWGFIGSKSIGSEQREYNSLNVLTQNNIHMRAFKDMYYCHYHEWPVVVPLIVVPNFCQVSEDIAEVIHTLAQLDNLLMEARDWDVPRKVQRRVSAIIPGDGVFIKRPDFVDGPNGVRMKIPTPTVLYRVGS